MPVQTVMDHTGDTRRQFDPTDLKQVEEAEERFVQLTGFGFTAAAGLDEGKSRVLKTFDPTVEETLLPRLIGG